MATIKRLEERSNPWEHKQEELTPTEDQQRVLEDIKEWLKSEEQFKSLTGYAGTGKTTVIGFIANYARIEGHKTAITATTNKAVKVLKERVKNSYFSTIHSLLNIRPKQKGSKEIFEPINWDKSDITEYDLVIIDECSMISSKESKSNPSLLSIIEKQVAGTNTKVLFSGDSAQLQPINEDVSKTFDFSPVSLTKIIRHGDVIAEKSKLVREAPQTVPIQALLDPPTISHISQQEASQLFKGFRDNPDRIRMLAWTNKSVHAWNRMLRAQDYGTDKLPRFVEGDIVIANELCEGKDEGIMLLNSEEAVVTFVQEDYDADILDLERSDGSTATVRVMRPSYAGEHQQELRGYAAAKNWKQFWALKKAYHDVRHSYALTVHKSQGSTFESVVIDSRDIQKNRDVLNRNQLLYVAMTRASEKVYLI